MCGDQRVKRPSVALALLTLPLIHALDIFGWFEERGIFGPGVWKIGGPSRGIFGPGVWKSGGPSTSITDALGYSSILDRSGWKIRCMELGSASPPLMTFLLSGFSKDCEQIACERSHKTPVAVRSPLWAKLFWAPLRQEWFLNPF